MRPPGNGCPVCGSLGMRADAEKSPARSSGDGGTAVLKSCDWRIRVPWYEPKTKVRFRISGPPAAKPNWLCFRSGLSTEKKLRAFSALLRRYSQSEPCNWLDPARVATTNRPPPKRPYSALKLLVITLNSWIASGDGRLKRVFCNRLLCSVPSKRTSFSVSRPPATMTAGPLRACAMDVGAEVRATPGTMRASSIALRPLSGSSCTRVRSTTSPTVDDRVSTPMASALTLMLSASCPTVNTGSTRAFWLTSSVIPSCRKRRKPDFSALIV